MSCAPCHECHACPECPSPDFLERNGTWLLTVVGMVVACFGGVLTYFLKSRCKRIKCLGVECVREVVALDPQNLTVEVTQPAA